MQTKSEKIADELILAINQGKYTSSMPSEQELARLYSTTPVTAGKALNILRDRNVVRRVPRLGTFVNRENKQTIRICLNLPEDMLLEISSLIKNKFPQLAIEFSMSMKDNPLESNYDIISTPATFPFSFSKYLKPMPDEIRKNFGRSSNYFSQLLEVFCDHNVYYSLPILFSPMVFAYNREIADELGINLSPFNFSFNDFIDCIKKVKNSCYNLCSSGAFDWIRYHLFKDLKTDSSIPLAEMKKILNQRRHDTVDIIDNLESREKAPFFERKSLFSFTCRQYLAVHKDKLDFKWDLLPSPQSANSRTAATGAFLAVLNRSTRADDAFKIVSAFLDDDIQEVIARHKFGLPVKKSFIYETLDSSKYRDDIFINEIRHMSTDNAANQELYTACRQLAHDFENQAIRADELAESSINIFLEIASAAKRQQTAEKNYVFADMSFCKLYFVSRRRRLVAVFHLFTA